MTLRSVCVGVFLCSLIFSTLVIPTMAQSTASVGGVITDATGATIPNAKVTVTNQGTGISLSSQTGNTGAYLFPSLPIGTYRLEAVAAGFEKAVVSDLNLPVATSVNRNIQLQIGQASEVVELTADAAVIDTATITMGQVIDQKTTQEIPLNGRHFVDLSLLTPGTVTPPQNGFLTAPLRGQGSFGFNTAGQREDTNNFLVNGINLSDMVQNQITFQPSINTVSEFKVDNSTFSAEYGRNSGAIANIATRSGTNDYHGELFEFLRNSALDSRNYFERTPHPAPFKRNQFGFNLGGPVNLPHFGEGGSALSYKGKNKTFFFFSYEGLRQRQGLTISGVTVPTIAQRAAVTDPVIARLLQFIPLPNVGTSSFSGSATAPVNLDQWTGDVSHTLATNDRLHGY